MAELNVLIVDDDKAMAGALRRALQAERYTATVCHGGQEAMSLLRKGPYDAVLLDFYMPDMTGLEVIKCIRHEFPDLDVVAMSGQGSLRMAMSMLQQNAFDYLDKPFEMSALMNVMQRLKDNKKSLEQVPAAPTGAVESPLPVIGQSRAFLQLLQKADRVADSDATIHIHGETGTGKEVIAHRIHYRSSRRHGPFIILNCSALPDTLLESELFGYEKGAFTDATAAKKGLLEAANRGTLFLDEIGEITPALQAKLLRAIETKRFRRLGGVKELSADVRIISATNRDLALAAEESRFRSDLYYRLSVISLDLPPLRMRREDIPLLIEHFLGRLTKGKKEKPALPPDIMERLVSYAWPGNVRELHNVVEHLVIFSGDGPMAIEHLPDRFLRPPSLIKAA